MQWNVLKYCQTLIDDEYKSSNIASQKEIYIVSISGNTNLNHTIDVIVTDTTKI